VCSALADPKPDHRWRMTMPKSKLPHPVHHCNCGNHAWAILSRGYVTMVSSQHAKLLASRRWNTLITPTGPIYARSHPNVLLHRLILGCPEVDHKNRNALDNRIDNIRPANRSQNSANRGRKNRDFPRGVYPNSAGFIARLRTGTKIYNLGTYKTKEEAALAYDKKAMETFGEYASLNFPKQPSLSP
jgi:hypothetical protein